MLLQNSRLKLDTIEFNLVINRYIKCFTASEVETSGASNLH